MLKAHNLTLTMKKRQKKIPTEDILQNTWQELLKNTEVTKDK